jgi:hypothetical protein
MGWTKGVACIGQVRRADGKTLEISSLCKPLLGKKRPIYEEWSNIRVQSLGFIAFIESPGKLITWIRKMPSKIPTFK